ncbi:ribosome quality control complex subunit NEMF-like [Watersipora subatra]|uniref:ribosome quality control complex subunit NEMF-like n=1 Tax=Watersipora subatra TaxID=2589382 RepID=UPI00355B092E
MKSRFSTVDIKAVILEIKEQFSGLRVANIYDIDHKTYLIKFTKPDSKKVLLIESGIRLHITEYDWPKAHFPSGFSMKMRKHLKSRRLEMVRQLGNDRIIQLQFGSGDAAYHIILELYDRGNIILADHELNILNILRPRADDSQDVRYAVRETYPLTLAKPLLPLPTLEELHELLLAAKQSDTLKRILNPKLTFGPAMIEHCLLKAGFPASATLSKGFDIACDLPRLLTALECGEQLMNRSEGHCQGYIIQKVEQKVKGEGEDKELLVYDEFHPFLYNQHENRRYLQFDSFNQAVDQFFSQLEAQKIEMKTVQAEKSALKKLDNVRRDHTKRLNELQEEQQLDERKAYIIEINLDIVEKALSVVRSALANQIDWGDIDDIIKEAQSHGDPVAMAIKRLKLEKNHFTVQLRDHYEEDSKPMTIDIDIALSAYANAKKYYDHKRHASQKEKKTIDASSKALKSAEKKTKQVLKEMKVTANIVKARKVMWFEKFNWFISSENYLVLAGRDGQQNEMLVRRYLKAGDVYVHADIHGASSIVVKNPQGGPISPKTLNEAGTMAICHSAAWDAKVVTSAWWVYHDQVSKTAPSGEYLSTGSFMVRGKKNFLPPSYLVYGFGLLFKLADDSLERHKGERRVRVLEEDMESLVTEDTEDLELELESGESEEEAGDDKPVLVTVEEEGGELNSDLQSDLIEKEESVEAKSDQELQEDNVPSDSESDRDTEEQRSEATDGTGTNGERHETDEGDEEVREKDEMDVDFPDTQIDLEHVRGSNFELRQRSISTVSGSSDVANDNLERALSTGSNKPMMSRKQRRDLKKAQKQGTAPTTGLVVPDEPAVSEKSEDRLRGDQVSDSQQDCPKSSQQPQSVSKRGQSGKLKKIKKKYADQDEEERRLRTSLMQSAERETKKRAKLKAQQQLQAEKQQRKIELAQKQQEYKRKQQEAAKAAMKAGQPLPAEEEDDAIDGSENPVDETGVLDTLTGLPVEVDTLLYAIPFCAPYSALQNFKYKVKLIPGSTKRGKATKSAINAFLHDRSTTQREKDLLKSLKDVDLSRNIPGKVKVTSSQVHKNKGKR